MKAKFIKAVNECDLLSVRISISNELMLDPRGKSFKEMLAYAESNLTNLYEEHDGVSYSEETGTWNESFLFNLKNDLDYNFSRERLTMYEKVAKFVLREKAENLDIEEREEKKQNCTNRSSNSENCTTRKTSENHSYTGVAVGGAVATVIGVCTSKVTLTLLGAAGVVVGGYLLYKSKK